MKTEQLKEIAQGSQFAALSSGRTHVQWDNKPSQLANEMQSVLSFAANEQHRTHLAEAAYAYSNMLEDFKADMVAPVYPVTALAGKYRKYAERSFYDRPKTNKGKDSPPSRIDIGSEFENYDLSGRALSVYMSNVDRDDAINQYGSVERWRFVLTQQLTHLLLLDRELTVAGIAQDSTQYAAGFSATASPLWTDAAATLLSDVQTGEDALLSPRDVLVFGYNVSRELQRHPQLTGSSVVSARSGKRKDNYPYVDHEYISNYFDSDIIVCPARYNSNQPATSPTLSRIWADYVIIMHNGGQIGVPELATPFMRTFKLQSASFPNVGGFTVKSVMDNNTMAGGELLMVGYWSQEKVFAQKAGYLLKAL